MSIKIKNKAAKANTASPAKKAPKQEEREYAPPVVGEYQGKPMLILTPDARFPFQFGLGKARILLKHLKCVQKFVESDGKKC